MLLVFLTMLVILVLAGAVAAFVAFPRNGAAVPAVPVARHRPGEDREVPPDAGRAAPGADPSPPSRTPPAPGEPWRSLLIG